MPRPTVHQRPWISSFLFPSVNAWCAQVTVVPDSKSISVFISGICQGSIKWISAGGHTDPICSGENKLMGLAFGYYGATVGASLYYVHEFEEVLTLRVGLEALVDFAELRPDALEYSIIDENGEEKNYWRKNGANVGPSAALTYKF